MLYKCFTSIPKSQDLFTANFCWQEAYENVYILILVRKYCNKSRFKYSRFGVWFYMYPNSQMRSWL